jgi:hypothetical protein
MFFKEVARGGERTRVLSISVIFTFSPLYRWATAAPQHRNNVVALLRPILNFAPRGKLWPQGGKCPPKVNFVPWGWHSLLPRHSSKQ